MAGVQAERRAQGVDKSLFQPSFQAGWPPVQTSEQKEPLQQQQNEPLRHHPGGIPNTSIPAAAPEPQNFAPVRYGSPSFDGTWPLFYLPSLGNAATRL